jgi:hypothetical protein
LVDELKQRRLLQVGGAIDLVDAVDGRRA